MNNYRAHYREKFISKNYNGWLHLAFTVSASLAVISYGISQLSDLTWNHWLTIPIAFIYTNLMEYWGHRGPMHHRTKLLSSVYKRHTQRHHRFFSHGDMAFNSSTDFHAVLFPPVLIMFFLLATVVPSALLINWLAGHNVAWLYVITVFAYFLNYELLHFIYHVREDSWLARLPGIAMMRKGHRHHHNPRLMQDYNFNITYPIGDWIFGTLYSDTIKKEHNAS